MMGYVRYAISSLQDLWLDHFIIIVFTALVLYYCRRTILELLIQSHVWGAAAVLFSVAMSSGCMWNAIRRPAFSLGTKQGPVLISNGKKRQLLAESYIVGVLNATTVIGMILSIEGAKRKGKLFQFQYVAGLALMFSSFTVLVAVYRVKMPW